MKALSRRVTRLEPPPALRPRPPHVLKVRDGETIEVAHERLKERWGRVPKGHTFMALPETMTVEVAQAKGEQRRQQKSYFAEDRISKRNRVSAA